MKNELKIEYTNTNKLQNLIEKAYFGKGQMGKLLGQENFIEVKENDDIMFTILKGLDRETIKITNNDIIDGSARFIVEESEKDIKLFPISIYCVNEDENYSFY